MQATKPILVLVLKGKGSYSSADFVSVFTFESEQEAESFCEAIKDMQAKFWTYAAIVAEGEVTETQADLLE